MNNLEKFLIEAKKQTYANGNSKKINSSRKGSYDYEYSNDYMTYHDTYFGGVNFMGEEVVYEKDIPIWGMNYYGVTLDMELSEEAIDMVLRPALMLVGTDDTIPVRGPREYTNGEYRYEFNVEGNLDNFTGEEVIYRGNHIIYVLKCHGGKIIK